MRFISVLTTRKPACLTPEPPTTISGSPKNSHAVSATSAKHSSEIDSTAVDAEFFSKEPENALVYASGEPTQPTSGNYVPYRQGKMDDWSDEEKVDHEFPSHGSLTRQKSLEDSSCPEIQPHEPNLVRVLGGGSRKSDTPTRNLSFVATSPLVYCSGKDRKDLRNFLLENIYGAQSQLF